MADDRHITIAGDFRENVDVTDSLTNGEACSAVNYSHAEGYRSRAIGDYSHAEGYRSNAKDHRSFVWSGSNDGDTEHESNGAGTFSLYPDVQDSRELDGVYIKGKTLRQCITDSFAGSFDNSSLMTSDNTWSGANAFNGGVTIGGVSKKLQVNVNMDAGSNSVSPIVNFYGTTKTRTPVFNNESSLGVMDTVATTEYVKSAIASSIGGVVSGFVKRNGGGATGSASRPVYVDSDGKVQSVTKDVVFRSSPSAGSSIVPVYLSGGSLTASSASVGSEQRFVYLKGGSLTPSSISLGEGGKRLVFFNGGGAENSSATVGGASLSRSSIVGIAPVFLSSGKVSVFSSIDIGNEAKPVYVKNGTLMACSKTIPDGGGGGISGNYVSSIALVGLGKTANNFLTSVTGNYESATGLVTLTGSKTRPELADVRGLMDERDSTGAITVKGSLSAVMSSCNTLGALCNAHTSSLYGIASSLSASPAKFAASIRFSSTGNGTAVSDVTLGVVGGGLTLGVTKGVTPLTTVMSATGSGNVVTGISQNGSSLVQNKEITVFTKASSSGNGNALTDISYNGDTVTAAKGYVVSNVINQQTASTTSFCNGVSYDSRGNLSFSWGTPSGSGSSAIETGIAMQVGEEMNMSNWGTYTISFQGALSRLTSGRAVVVTGVNIAGTGANYTSINGFNAFVSGKSVTITVSVHVAYAGSHAVKVSGSTVSFVALG